MNWSFQVCCGLLLCSSYVLNAQDMKTVEKNFDTQGVIQIKNQEISALEQYELRFSISVDDLRSKSLKISSFWNTSNSAPSPLMVVVKHPSGMQNWMMHQYQLKMAKVIWLNRSLPLDYTPCSVTFSTFAANKTSFGAKISLISNHLQLNEESELEHVLPLSPHVLEYRASKQDLNSTLWIHSTSKQNHICALISVQPLHEGTRADDFNPGPKSRYQTMLGQAVIDVKMENEFAPGFFVIIQVSANSYQDKRCFDNEVFENHHPRIKGVQFKISKSDYKVSAVSWALTLIYITSCGFAVLLTLCCAVPIEGKHVTRLKKLARSTTRRIKGRSRRRRHQVEDRLGDNHNAAPPGTTLEQDSESEIDAVDGIVMSRQALDEDFVQTIMNHMQNCVFSLLQDEKISPASQVEGDCKEIVIVNLYKQLNKDKLNHCEERRKGEDLTLADFATNCDKDLFPNSLRMKSSLYLWIILLMGIFYTLPVGQLLLVNQNEVLNNGNLDTCYFNFLCKVQVGYLEDYGHVFSNIAYVVSGLFFIAICYVRKTRDREYRAKMGQPCCGIPEQFGIFYAMGGALAITGILSACYHICPTKVNFQFDTTFMYVIAVLVFMKVYQFRHPDITSNAYIVFLVIGLALCIEVIGYYTENLGYWIIFVGFYIGIVIIFLIHTYYNGMYKLFFAAMTNIFHNVIKLRFKVLRPARVKQFMICSVAIFINFLLASYFLYKRRPGISRYLLVILLANMVCYVTYYCCMKMYYRFYHKKKHEGISKTSVLYFILSVIFMSIGVIYFTQELKSSSKTPAQSRDLNRPCAIFFFDNHDIWHFTSAAGLFFNFMMILTLEDNNLEIPWEQLSVF